MKRCPYCGAELNDNYSFSENVAKSLQKVGQPLII